MNLQNQIRLVARRRSFGIELITVLLLLMAMAQPAPAQQVLSPGSLSPAVPPALQQLQSGVTDMLSPPGTTPGGGPGTSEFRWGPVQTNEMDVFAPAGTAASGEKADQPFKWGPLTLRPHLLYRFLYADGILATTNKPVITVIHELAPGFLLEIGSHWKLDYTPTWRFYSRTNFQDTLDHNVILTGGTTFEDWVFGLSQGFTRSSAPLIETGTQTAQDTYSTGINGSYRMNSKMSLDLGLSQVFRDAQDFQSSREWATLDWLNYQFFPRLNIAIGAGFGFVDVETGPDMTYEQLQGRINWRATDKLSFQLRAGAEDRQFHVGGASDVINPVFGAAVEYMPFEVTKISLRAERTVSASYFANEVVENTSVGANLNQRLFKKIYADLGGEYHTVKYVGSTASSSNLRTDDYYALNARLSYLFLKRGSLAAFYQYSRNDSSPASSGFSYLSRQVGVELGYRY
ncbi:MAG: outer membrane beta-barrel protein [Verrucomicrobia bacterium]|nr:outer membrane beta-barrel protein [Verrucomicrobiota bacterium]